MERNDLRMSRCTHYGSNGHCLKHSRCENGCSVTLDCDVDNPDDCKDYEAPKGNCDNWQPKIGQKVYLDFGNIQRFHQVTDVDKDMFYVSEILSFDLSLKKHVPANKIHCYESKEAYDKYHEIVECRDRIHELVDGLEDSMVGDIEEIILSYIKGKQQ